MTDEPPTRAIRLYVTQPLAPGADLALDRDQAHYLANVMRLGLGDSFLAFNSEDGEWRVETLELTKRSVRIRCAAKTRPAAPPPDLELLFAPIKKARTDFIVEKATELGCRRIRPVITRRTNAERVKVDRLQAHAIEAAEQCGLVFVPEVLEPRALGATLEAWEPRRRLYFCDEAGGSALLSAAAHPGPAAILIGPEGGFDPAEAARLRETAFATPVSLGPRILRADTAAAAAIALWQSSVGDWRDARLAPEDAEG